MLLTAALFYIPCTTTYRASCQALRFRLYSAQAQGEITFTLAYLLQLRLCFGELLYQLRIHFVPGLFLLRNQRNIFVCKKCFFPMGTNTGFLAEHLVCKNVQAWLRVSFASTSQPFLNLVPYIRQTHSRNWIFWTWSWNQKVSIPLLWAPKPAMSPTVLPVLEVGWVHAHFYRPPFCP